MSYYWTSRGSWLGLRQPAALRARLDTGTFWHTRCLIGLNWPRSAACSLLWETQSMQLVSGLENRNNVTFCVVFVTTVAQMPLLTLDCIAGLWHYFPLVFPITKFFWVNSYWSTSALISVKYFALSPSDYQCQNIAFSIRIVALNSLISALHPVWIPSFTELPGQRRRPPYPQPFPWLLQQSPHCQCRKLECCIQNICQCLLHAKHPDLMKMIAGQFLHTKYLWLFLCLIVGFSALTVTYHFG